ncbi:pilus assembly protein TadG-related protein [Aeromicrobium terrae]|uniref:pilus assembly protein TadG-related protein n=1 Tax=Aeromicrobium terrae TaxID=2498846 RepID=UPI00164F6BA6|nr:pilus assembly protein TadG-related protein [Aeromicrobium terrae]
MTVMTVGFLVLVGLLTVVVVDASDAFLERQKLHNLADGAALAAADALDEDGYYADHRIRLDPSDARRLVGDYLSGEAVRLVAVRADADSVSVRLERDLDLAITPPGWEESATIVSEATARLRPASP